MSTLPEIAVAEEKKKELAPQDVANLPKTTGERGYDIIQFLTGKAFIMAFTAAIAYVARYGKSSYKVAGVDVPNVIKHSQEAIEHKLLHNEIFPLAEKGEFAKRLGSAAANTTVLFWGGTMFAPFMRQIENNRERISTWINKHHGKPGEAEISHNRLKDEPKQSWGDVIKGRMVGWAVVFSSFLAVDGINTLSHSNEKKGMYWLDKCEEGIGRWIAGFSKSGKDIAKTPVTQALTEAQKTHKGYRFGKILALDFFATSAAIAIWNFVSRRSARQRKMQAGQEADHTLRPLVFPAGEIESTAEAPKENQQRTFTSRIKAACAPCALRADKERQSVPKPKSFLAAAQSSAEQEPMLASR